MARSPNDRKTGGSKAVTWIKATAEGCGLTWLAKDGAP
jgi:hypothetical protein